MAKELYLKDVYVHLNLPTELGTEQIAYHFRCPQEKNSSQIETVKVAFWRAPLNPDLDLDQITQRLIEVIKAVNHEKELH